MLFWYLFIFLVCLYGYKLAEYNLIITAPCECVIGLAGYITPL